MTQFFRDEARWGRYASWGGIAAVILWVVGALVLFANEPDRESADEILAFYQDEENSILIGTWVFTAGVLLFFWFLSALRERFVALEGAVARVSSLAYAAGVAVAIFLMGFPAVDASGALVGDELSPEAAQAIGSMNTVFFIGAEMMGVLFLAAVGALILRTGALPVWWTWVTWLLAVWMFIFPIGWLGLLIGFPAWVLITSLFLGLRRAEVRAGP